MEFSIAGLTENQLQIKSLIKEFCKREVDPKKMMELSDKATKSKTIEELRSYQPKELIDKLFQVGLLQLTVPIEYGGGGADFLTRVIALEQAGYSGGLVGPILSTVWMYCSNLRCRLVPKAQQDWIFTQFMKNRGLELAEADSEPAGCTDIHWGYDGPRAEMNVTAEKTGNEWVINGNKMFCSSGGVADYIMVYCRTDKTKPISQGVSYIWVKKDTPGMTMEPNRMISDLIGGNVQIHFDNVRVPDYHLVGEVNKGFAIKKSSAYYRMLPMVVMLGSAQRLYEQIREYAKERVQGGKPIIEHSMVANMLGEMAVTLEANRALTRMAAWECDQRDNAGLPINIFWEEAVRYAMKKMCWRLSEIASEIYGGMAASLDMPVESFVRRAFRMLHTGSCTEINAVFCSQAYDDR
jgi:alkylation response protein AidB-like acyl-CoA dehydrogenase